MGKHEKELAGGKRSATNVSLDAEIVAEAKRLGINISRACESGLTQQIAQERGRIWREENAAAMDAANVWVEENGLPLDAYRRF